VLNRLPRHNAHWHYAESGKWDAGEAHDQLRAMEAIVKTLMRLDAEQRQ